MSLAFLNRFNLYFVEGQNKIQFYYKAENFEQSIFKSIFKKKEVDFRESNDPQEIITSYIKEISARYKKPLRYNYLGNVYIVLKEGFSLADIDFRNK